MSRRFMSILAISLMIALSVGATAFGAPMELILATTTSTRDTGLLDVLLPMFQEKTGYNVKTIAVGTGAALALGEKGEADVLLCHAPASEMKLVESGDVINRQLVMHNDFVIVGSPEDPAGVKGFKSATDALKKIADSEAVFVSRADDSGTHKKEKEVWNKLQFQPSGNAWYLEAGTGMANTLNIANEKLAYCLTDRGTYLSMKDRLDLVVLVEGDAILLNIYHVMQVNPEKHKVVEGPGGEAFVEFMVSEEVQAIISEFGIDKYGSPLFFPDAGKSMEELGG
ncbi:MAG: solute-binding protein [Firmicutes bacterium]|jgi:tungstate transport system substrate-binding protein|nr:solute-binding protein [Bacillota bacterium]